MKAKRRAKFCKHRAKPSDRPLEYAYSREQIDDMLAYWNAKLSKVGLPAINSKAQIVAMLSRTKAGK
jgi:hypothetical protein